MQDDAPRTWLIQSTKENLTQTKDSYSILLPLNFSTAVFSLQLAVPVPTLTMLERFHINSKSNYIILRRKIHQELSNPEQYLKSKLLEARSRHRRKNHNTLALFLRFGWFYHHSHCFPLLHSPATDPPLTWECEFWYRHSLSTTKPWSCIRTPAQYC